MGKGKKMCKHRTLVLDSLFLAMQYRNREICTSTKITEEHRKLVNSNQLYCCRRLCPFYESR